MSGEGERLERLSRDIEEIKETVKLNAELLKKYEAAYLHKIIDLFPYVVSLVKSDFICADSKSDLPGAYKEGEQIKNVLDSNGHNVTLKRHPVSKADFLANLQNKYIVHLAGHGGFSGLSGQVAFGFDDGFVYPSDISALSSVPTLLFYAGTCLSGKNKTMASIFLGKGTKCYVGFTGTGADWTFKYFADLVYKKWLNEKKSFKIALDEADDVYPSLSCWVMWE